MCYGLTGLWYSVWFQDVESFLTDYGIRPDDVYTIEDTLARKEPLPAVMSAKQLFTEV